jgi:hypothetical protein
MKRENPVVARRLAAAIALAWLAAVGFDFLLHAGILRGMYLSPGSFLLPPELAFRRIPLGYLALLLVSILLAWLMRLGGISGLQAGTRFGLLFGILSWGTWCLALASITTAPWGLLIAWFVGQSLEAGLIGAVLGAALPADSLRRLAGWVALLLVCCVFLGVLAQNT